MRWDQSSSEMSARPQAHDDYSSATGLPTPESNGREIENDPQATAKTLHEEHVHRNQLPTLPARHTTDPRYRYEVQVAQQPYRARMCGYGDRDRRPITAPPIFRLRIFDLATSKEVDYNANGLQHRKFAAIVRIFSVDGMEDKGIIKAPGTASSSTMPSPVPHYSPGPMREGYLPSAASTQPGSDFGVSRSSSFSSYPQSYGHSISESPYNSNFGYHAMSPIAVPAVPPQRSLFNYEAAESPYARSQVSFDVRPEPNVTYARNLIGMTCATGWTLQDTHDKWGIFFIFGDLSVRNEDWFRLKCQVFDITPPADDTESLLAFARGSNSAPDVVKSGAKAKQLPKNLQDVAGNATSAFCPCIGHVFTVPIRVYSAKKFPGVEDSTPLSKTFASQGVKITVRKEKERESRLKSGEKRKRHGSVNEDGDVDHDD